MLFGIAIAIYPAIQNKLEKDKYETDAKAYVDTVDSASNDEIEAYREKVRQYNTTFSEESYEALDELIGYVKIPSLNINYPIKRGTDEDTLNNAIGHVEGTSIPSAEIGNHAAISGHNGLYGKEFFTNIDQLKAGDIVEIKTYDSRLTYEVIDYEVILPQEVHFKVSGEHNYLTLITCTPYGSNTHRLLIKCELVKVEEVER